MNNHLPPLLAHRPPLAKLALAVGVPSLFGIATGVMLGVSEAGYTALSVLGIAGGFIAGLEHSNARDGLRRGLVGGSCFGLFILLAHHAAGTEPKAHLPEPEILLVVLTTAFGAGLGALGARRRARHEGPQPQAQPHAETPIADTPWTRIVDLNRGSIDELVQLPVVGRRAAERIVVHRTEHGPFASVEELTRVEGFTPSRVAQLARRATVQEA